MRSEPDQTTTESLMRLRNAKRDMSLWGALSPSRIEGIIAEMPYPIAALDRHGVILAINEAWRRFARENGAPTLADTSVGMDYLAVCRRATGPFTEDAREALTGIQSVLDGVQPLFTLEYPCPSPTEQRWYLLHVTSLPSDQGGAIVSHIQIPKRQTEEEHAQALATETEARTKAEATARQLSRLQAITDTALTRQSLPELEAALMERIQRVMAVDYVWLMLATEDERELVMRATRGPEVGLEHARLQVGQGLMGRIALSREPVVVDDLSTVEVAYREIAERGEIRSVAGVPLLTADRLVGALSVGSKKPRHFTPDDVDFLRLVSDRIALALERARLDGVAQRARAEAETRASQLAAVVEAINDPLFVFDREGNILLQNAADRAFMGLAPGAPGPRTIAERKELAPPRDLEGELLPGERGPTARILRGETLRGEHEQDLLINILDDQTVVVSASGSPIRDAQGNITGGAVVIRDVTERRRLERTLEERAEQLAAILEAMSDSLVVFDREGNILLQNAADRAFIGLTPGAPGPRTIYERGHKLQLSDLEGQPLPIAQWPTVRILQGEIFEGSHIMDLIFRRVDGREAVASVSGAPIRDTQGNVVGGVMVVRDVTERRTLERALEERASQLAAIIEAITDPLLVFDREGNILLQNAADRALMGLAPGAPSPQTTRERAEIVPLFDIQGEPVPAARRPSSRILRGETLRGEHEQDLLIQTPDGRMVVSSASGGPIRDAQGNITGGALVIHDVTERRRLERALEERANQLAAIVEAITDPLYVFDREGAILLQNAADRAFMRVESGAPNPPTISERGKLLRLRDLQGRPLPMDQWPPFRILRGETLHSPHTADLGAHAPDGHEMVANVSGGPIRDARGGIVGGVLVVRDVTERRAMEQRTQTLLEALLAMAEALVSTEAPAVGIPGMDLASRRLAELTRDALGCERISIVALEPDTLAMRAVVRLGWPPEEEQQWYRESTRYRLSALIPAPLIARLRAGETVLTNRAPPWSAAPTTDGAKLLVAPLRVGAELIGALALDYGDKPHMYTAAEISLTGAVGKLAALVLERDRLLREREEAIASELAARQVQERMDEFLATATHDLRSPIAAAKLAAQVARRRIERQLAIVTSGEAALPAVAPSISAIRTNLEVIEGSMNRLAQLIDRLMDISRVRAGKLALQMEPCDLRPIVRRAVEEQRLLEPNRALRLRLPSRPITVRADADRAGQVVTNFLTNALRYAPGDSPIDISLRITGRQARLSVRDRGPGIRPEEQAGIWERFRQAERGKTAAAKSGGLGLGLYISREIIRLHGGQIGVRSAPGQGSTFWFTLPLAADAGNP